MERLWLELRALICLCPCFNRGLIIGGLVVYIAALLTHHLSQ